MLGLLRGWAWFNIVRGVRAGPLGPAHQAVPGERSAAAEPLTQGALGNHGRADGTLTAEQEPRISSGRAQEKLQRAHGGCLGAAGRRRAWLAAISLGELSASIDPRMPEWGNPARDNRVTPR